MSASQMQQRNDDEHENQSMRSDESADVIDIGGSALARRPALKSPKANAGRRLLAGQTRRGTDVDTILKGLWSYLKAGSSIAVDTNLRIYVSAKRLWRHDDSGSVELVFEMNPNKPKALASATELVLSYPKHGAKSAAGTGKSASAGPRFSYNFTTGSKAEISRFEADALHLYRIAEQAQTNSQERLARPPMQ